MGAYLRLHLEKGINGQLRKVVRLGHSILGKVFPVASWVQMLFGGIAALGFCRGDHLGQCAAHFIMGSAFIGYGIILTIMMLVGQHWLRRTGRSQEFFDSLIIAAWGCVNTFTEHHWGGAWVENDIQHTTMGVIWWAAGLAGVWLSRDKHGRPKRNFVPGFVIFITGWGMSGHPQHLMLSTMIHKMFGYTLMAAGLTRIIEVSFVLRDKQNANGDDGEPHSFQYVPAFVGLLFASRSIANVPSFSMPRAFCLWAPPKNKWSSYPGPASLMLHTYWFYIHSLSLYSSSLTFYYTSTPPMPLHHYHRKISKGFRESMDSHQQIRDISEMPKNLN